MSNFVGLNTALTGLRASQHALDTASHNVANANTKGYTRQRVDLLASRPFASPVGPLGTGVTVAGIVRLRDAFLDARVRTTLGEFSRLDTRAQLLGRAETALAEPDDGIAEAMGALWNAFEDLAMDPAGAGPRRQVVGALESLSSRVRSVAGAWADLGRDTEQRLHSDLAEANDLLQRVNDLNATILRAQGPDGALPGDLLDERDNHLDRLAELVGATASTDAEGRAVVSVGGIALPPVGAVPPLGYTQGAVGLSDGSAPEGWQVGGQVGGTVRFLTADLRAMTAGLDAFAGELAAALNGQHSLGSTAAEPQGPGGPLLGFDPARGAASLRVDGALAADPRLLAAAAAPGAPHDGGNAAALAGVRTAVAGGGRTVQQRYDELTTAIASDVAAVSRAADGQHDLAVAAQSARSGMHGVSLDEEMADVVRFQRSLEAMSRVMTAVDQALDVLINRTGVVGR